MSVHPDGTGTGWTNVEAVDVDQPHGKDYLYSQHIAKGVRKRMNQEHSAFADATVGGIHKPGGCAVLGMEITDAAGDPTGAVIYDGTYRARGLVWSYVVQAGANKGVLFCITDAAGTSTSAVDWTVVKLHPDLQWGGGDITWAGAHEFDASVDISGNVALDGDLTIDGKLIIDSSADFSAVFIAKDFSVDGTASFGGDVAFVADVSIDGTLAVQDIVLTGDSTFTFDPIAGETGPTFGILGDWSTRAVCVTYTARTDGQVAVVFFHNAQREIAIETPAGTDRQIHDVGAGDWHSVSCLIKKGNTWAATLDTTTYTTCNVYWIPFGDNT